MIIQISHLITKASLTQEALKFMFGLLSTAIGFFLALFFNRRSDEKKEKMIFKNIKKSLLTELIQNQYVIDHSFHEYIDDVILNDLDISISCFQLTNNQFLKYSDHELLTNLQLYIHQCRICNKQKNQLKIFESTTMD